MNKTRRKLLESVIDKLTDTKNDIETIADEEREAYDNLPENLQNTAKAEAMDYNADTLYQACDDIDDIIGELEAVLDNE